MDIQSILSIPLGNLHQEDQRVWVGNNLGIFTVKSAYYIALNSQYTNVAEGSSAGDPYCSMWKMLWRMKVPNKIAFLHGGRVRMGSQR